MPRKKKPAPPPETQAAEILDAKGNGPISAAIERRAAEPPALTSAGVQSKTKSGKEPGTRPLRHLDNAPASPERPKGLDPWRPRQPGMPRSPGRPKERTFEEDARDILAHGIPKKLRTLVVTRTGLPLDVAAHMSLRQAVILLLIHDAIDRGLYDRLDRVLDRTDPKSRRVEHRGGVAHLHAIAPKVLGLDEAGAADLYRELVQGGASAVIDAEVVEDDAAS